MSIATIETNTISMVLNQQIANWNVLQTKLLNFHWNVRGPHFFTLHAKFEEIYNETSVHADVLAERLLAVEGIPVATLAGALKLSTVQEAVGGETAVQMAAAIAADFTQIVDELKAGIKIAGFSEDEATADLLLGIQTGLEKHVWMLNAFLG